MKKLSTALIILWAFMASGSLHAAYVLQDGKLMKAQHFATMSLGEHFEKGKTAFDQQKWEEAANQFRIVIVSFPETLWAQDATFYLGVSCYHLSDYELADRYLTTYLAQQGHAENFEKAWEYKFDVAEAYQQGAKRHLFNIDQMPQWLPAKDQALEIYEEIISSLPGHELAAKALASKAQLLMAMKDYDGAVEAFTSLIDRYPKNENVPASYLAIADIYRKQSQAQGNNPDLLVLAEMNLCQFKERFPRDNERLAKVREILQEMQENSAESLYETAKFYEKIKKPRAAAVYYINTIYKFPNTEVAKRCIKKLNKLQDVVSQMNLSLDYKDYESLS
ncbi:MAG: tetratricopeptide repeat protein [Chlamydiota bacterium]